MTDVPKNGADGLSIAMRAVEFRHRRKRRANVDRAREPSPLRRARIFPYATRVFILRWRMVLLAAAVLIPTTSGMYMAGQSLNERRQAPEERQAPVQTGDERPDTAESPLQTETFPEFGDLQPAESRPSVFLPTIQASPPVAQESETPPSSEAETDNAQSPSPVDASPEPPPENVDSAPSSSGAVKPDRPATGASEDDGSRARLLEGPAPAPNRKSAGTIAVARGAPQDRSEPVLGDAGKQRIGHAEVRRQHTRSLRKLVKSRIAERAVSQRATAPRPFVLPLALKPTPQ